MHVRRQSALHSWLLDVNEYVYEDHHKRTIYNFFGLRPYYLSQPKQLVIKKQGLINHRQSRSFLSGI